MITVTDKFQPYIGTKEYNGIVGTIQRWFYGGDLVKASWCATSMSFFMHEMGLLKQIGGKNENVYRMMMAASKSGYGRFYFRDEIPKLMNIMRGTIVFMLNSGTVMTETSSKHVTSVYQNFKWTGSGYWQGLGGNQSDMIKVSQYTQARIYAIFIPDYTADETLRRGDKGEAVKQLQADLKSLGYTDDDGYALEVDGSFGRRTEEALKKFQRDYDLVVDGVYGKQSRDKMASIEKGVAVKVTTLLNCRTGAGTQYPIKAVLKAGSIYHYTHEYGEWLYLVEPKGWVNCNYVTTKL